MPRLSLALASAAGLATPMTRAQPARMRTLGVFSLLGDGLQLVYPADTTDTRLDRNLRESLPTQVIGFDLLLITRNRGDASFPLRDGFSVGRGTVEDIGCYLDRSTEIKNNETGYLSTGFLGAYVMLRLQLMDAQSGDTPRKRSRCCAPWCRTTWHG
ncbi:MAG: hypothetical protein Q8R98_25420 [Rubrivivax sp.]|nr:hypothetical protein [Rubrivivax sp.]